MKVDDNITKLINEEMNDYDFLGNDKYEMSLENLQLLENEDFQKQFIIDFLIGKSEKYEILDSIEIKILGDWERIGDDFDDRLGIECDVNIKYFYDEKKEPITFSILFESNNISISDGDINWNDIDVTLFAPDGDEIKFSALESAPNNIQELFIREFIGDVFKQENSFELPFT